MTDDETPAPSSGGSGADGDDVSVDGNDAPADGNDAPADGKTGTFLVTHADADSAVFRDVHDGQVHTVSSNPGVEAEDVIEATIAPDPPLEVAYQVVAVERRWTVPIEDSGEPPTTQERSIADDQPVGELTREPRAGVGELHVLTVPEGTTEEAVADVLEDREGTLARAARLGVNRVEVRSAPGVVSVRYLP
ncbi:DUF5812 family protein [Halopenitus persicus]|uniref:Uncharacterized protein n=1 Tax=Halopenitus persicus TaxID=1048396 RepID=A0A1H3ENC3_9EURY|nr:DUF5812 family protein [Halopenitus persicus]SDX79459.1 hypothetical protein SAMN05216564_101491 [Halopenitus persicus]